jgi:AcrR family transcriptional regulator
MTDPLTSWGHVDDPADGPDAEDPRIRRTRALVLEHARQRLADHGPSAVQFSALAEQAGVSRQTLYRHWPTPEALVADLMSRRIALEPTGHAPDVETGLRDYLRALRVGLADPATAAAYGLLMSAAHHDAAAAGSLRSISESRRAMLNARLAGLREPLCSEEFALVVGPLMYLRFVVHSDITEEAIELVVRSGLTSRGPG